jgi:hypothetical protein
MAGAALLGKFDLGQPRDENGRWTTESGGQASQTRYETDNHDGTNSRSDTSSQQKTAENCAEEWRQAYERCEGLLRLPNFHPDRVLLGGHKTLIGCAKGFVSERCGGNAVSR